MFVCKGGAVAGLWHVVVRLEGFEVGVEGVLSTQGMHLQAM